MPVAEKHIQAEIRAALNRLPHTRMFLNPVGQDKVTNVRYGLAVGSPDLIGISYGYIVGIEIKTPIGRVREEQKLFHAWAKKFGWVMGVARTVPDALAIVDEAKQRALTSTWARSFFNL